MTTRNKLCDRREVRSTIRRHRHEQHLLLAHSCDLSTARNSTRIRQQYDLEQYRWIVRRATHLIVRVAVVENTQIELVLDQVTQRMFERARKDLLFK